MPPMTRHKFQECGVGRTQMLQEGEFKIGGKETEGQPCLIV